MNKKRKFFRWCVTFIVIMSIVFSTNTIFFSSSGIKVEQLEVHAATKKYPTSWVKNDRDSYTKSKKMKKAAKSVMVSALAGIITGGAKTAKDIAGWTVTALLGQYFTNSDTEDTRIEINYYYRELGPPYQDKNLGIWLGNFENKKVVTTYRVKNNVKTKLGTKTYYMKTTQVWAF